MVFGMRLQSSLEVDGYIQKKKKSPETAVTQAIDHVKSKYYGDYDSQEVTDHVLNAYLGSLDRHSRYFHKSQHTQYRNFVSGKYEGLGFEFMTGNASLYVSRVLKDSPAEKSGFYAGDKVLTIRNTPITGEYVNLDSIQVLCNSSPGDTIQFQINRLGSQEVRSLDVIVGSVKIPVVRAIPVKDEKILYVDIQRFTNDVYQDFMEETEPYLQNGEYDLIIDVRGNPGGTLEETVKIINQFFKESDQPLLSTIYRGGRKREFESTGRTFISVNEIVVLIDDESASSSEIVAGVLQDLDKAVIIGLPSYGKGSIQQNYMLSNGGSIQLTIGAYMLPGGRLIGSRHDSLNIWPDIEINEMRCLDSIPTRFIAQSAEDLIMTRLDIFGAMPDRADQIEEFLPEIRNAIKDLGISESCLEYVAQQLVFEIWRETSHEDEALDQKGADMAISRAIEILQ